MCSLVLLAQRWCWLSCPTLFPLPRLHHQPTGVWRPIPSFMWRAAACSFTRQLIPFCFGTFYFFSNFSPVNFPSLHNSSSLDVAVLTVVSFSSPCSLLSLSLSLHHSSGHFAKLCFSTSPLNFVFISTIVFLTGKRLFRHSESFYCNCAWFTPSYLCGNINCSALYNRLAFPPLEVLPSASTFLLSCLTNQLFILFHNK